MDWVGDDSLAVGICAGFIALATVAASIFAYFLKEQTYEDAYANRRKITNLDWINDSPNQSPTHTSKKKEKKKMSSKKASSGNTVFSKPHKDSHMVKEVPREIPNGSISKSSVSEQVSDHESEFVLVSKNKSDLSTPSISPSPKKSSKQLAQKKFSNESDLHNLQFDVKEEIVAEANVELSTATPTPPDVIPNIANVAQVKKGKKSKTVTEHSDAPKFVIDEYKSHKTEENVMLSCTDVINHLLKDTWSKTDVATLFDFIKSNYKDVAILSDIDNAKSNEVAALQNRVDNLEILYKNEQSRFNQSQNQCSVLQATIVKDSLTKESLGKTIEEHVCRIDSQRSANQQLQMETHRLQLELSNCKIAMNESSQQFKKQLQNQQHALSTANTQLTSIETRNSELEGKLSVYEKQIHSLQSVQQNYLVSRRENERLSQSMVDARGELNAKDQEIDRLFHENNQMRQLSESVQRQSQDFEQYKTEHCMKTDELLRQIELLKEANNSQVNELQCRNSELENELLSLRNNNETILNLQAENAKLSSRLKEVEQTVKNLLQELFPQLNIADQEFNSWLTLTKSFLQCTLSENSKQLAEKESTVTELMSKCDQYQTTIDNTMEMVNDLSSSLKKEEENHNQIIEELNLKIEKLQGENNLLSAEAGRCVNLELEKKELMQENAKLKSAVVPDTITENGVNGIDKPQPEEDIDSVKLASTKDPRHSDEWRKKYIELETLYEKSNEQNGNIVASLQEQIDTVGNELLEVKNLEIEFSKEKEILESKVADLNNANCRFESEKNAVQSELAEIKKTYASLSKQNEEKSEIIMQLESQINELKNEKFNNDNEDKLKMSAQIENVTAQLNKQRAEVEQLIKMKEDYQEVVTQNSKNISAIETLEASLSDLQKQNKTLHDSLNVVTRDKMALDEEVADLRANNHIDKSKYDQLQHDYNVLSSKLDMELKQTNALNENLQTLKKSVEDLSLEKEHVVSQKNELLSQHAVEKEEIKSQFAEKEKMLSVEMESKMKSIEQSSNDSKQMLAETTARITELENELKDLHEVQQRDYQALNDKTDALSKSEQSLAVATKALEELRQTTADKEAFECIKAENASLKEELHNERKRIKELEASPNFDKKKDEKS